MSDVADLAGLALREAQLKTQLDAVQAYAASVKALYESARGQVQAAMDSESARGVTAFSATLPTGRLVAKVSLTDPDPAPEISDEKAFLDWVRDTYPTVHSVRVVREASPAWQRGLFAAMKKSGKPVDPETGELVPGIEIPTARKRGHRLVFVDDGADAITESFLDGLTTPDVLPELLALPAEPDDAA